MNLYISKSEIEQRRKKILNIMEEQKADAFVLFNPKSIFYLSNFAFIPTERPAAAVLTSSNKMIAFVPRLEMEHVSTTAVFDRIEAYEEYPGKTHPLEQFGQMLRQAGYKKILADGQGYMGLFGYEGPGLADDLVDTEIIDGSQIINYLRHCKSQQEINLIRESCRWGNLAMQYLQNYVGIGRDETEISVKASYDATKAMVDTLGSTFESRGGGDLSAHAGFRGQIGANSAHPHAIGKHLKLNEGDTLGTGSSATVWGYHSELERTLFVGEPSSEQIKYFELMVESQDIAFETIKPGKSCADVDRAVRSFIEENGLQETWRHHVGHNIGLEAHEAPFLDIGDDREIKEGMLFTVEPGIYVPGLGGFRHSDTVVVTKDGIEMLTYYPRDLDSMVCSV